jgi:hypothetical protein
VSRKDERLLVERLRALDEPSVLAQEKANWDKNVKRTALWLAKSRNREAATKEDTREAEALLKSRAAAGVKERATQRVEART